MGMRSNSSIRDLSAFNQLVTDIYDAGLDETLWSGVLKQIMQSMNAQSGLLRTQDLRSKAVGKYITEGLDPDFRQRYKEHYIHLDNLVPAAAKKPTGSIQQTIHLMQESFFKSEFYNDFALPQGQVHSIGSILTRNNTQLAVFGLHRPDRAGNYTPDEITLLELLIPHLQRALQVNQQLSQLTNDNDATHDALDRLMIGVILVDGSGKPLFLNKKAEAIVADGDELTISRNAIRATTWPETQALHKLIFAATQTPQRTGGGLTTSGYSSTRSLNILVTPVGKDHSSHFQFDTSHVAAALFIGTTEQYVEFSRETLMHLYSLTPAEARLAVTLANGHSLETIAAEFNLSLHTIRSQLKSCFRKTKTNRQAELVKLVFCAGSLMIDNCDV